MTTNETTIELMQAAGFRLDERPPDPHDPWNAFAETLTDRQFIAVVDALEREARERGANTR